MVPCRDDTSWNSDWVPRNHPNEEQVSWEELGQEAFIWFNFEVKIEWIVGGEDFSWDARGVPALDWALMLSWIPVQMRKSGSCRTESSNIDLWYQFSRNGDDVMMRSSYNNNTARVSINELEFLSMTPIVEAYNLITKFHPEARGSRNLTDLVGSAILPNRHA